MPALKSNVAPTASRTILRMTWGLFFGAPFAVAGHAWGLHWLTCGVALIATGVVLGSLIPRIALAAASRRRNSTCQSQPPAPDLRETTAAKPEGRQDYSTWRRLAEEKACLEHLDSERAFQTIRRSARPPKTGLSGENCSIWNSRISTSNLAVFVMHPATPRPGLEIGLHRATGDRRAREAVHIRQMNADISARRRVL